jgi:hypothetical protein
MPLETSRPGKKDGSNGCEKMVLTQGSKVELVWMHGHKDIKNLTLIQWTDTPKYVSNN